MKKYEAPKAELILLHTEDLMAQSGVKPSLAVADIDTGSISASAIDLTKL